MIRLIGLALCFVEGGPAKIFAELLWTLHPAAYKSVASFS